jgi:hypothetical protein
VTWHDVSMIKRLGVASLGVAGLAYITGPLPVLVGFILLVPTTVVWSAWKQHTDSLDENECE